MYQSDITSEFQPMKCFVISDFQTIFNTQLICLFIIWLHTKLYIRKYKVLNIKHYHCTLLLTLIVYHVITSRRLRWAGHVARVGEAETYIGVDGRIILKWIFQEWDCGMDWIDLSQDRDR